MSSALASLGVLNAFGGHWRDALWAVEKPLPVEPDLFDQAGSPSTGSPLTVMDTGERLQADFDGQNLTTGPHAMALLRPHLPEDTWRAIDLLQCSKWPMDTHCGQRDLPPAARHG